MSFGLVVLAIGRDASDGDVRMMVGRCRSLDHPEGELDERIVGFYEQLRARFPDFAPYPDDSPWMSMPLAVGIDHVDMLLAFGPSSDSAIDCVQELAENFGLTIYDPQGDEVFRPSGDRGPRS